jgi:transposase
MSRVFTEEFRENAVRLALRSDRSYTQVASDLGINYWTLRNWCKVREVNKRSKKKPPRQASAVPVTGETLEEKVKRLEGENAALRKKNEELETDRAILKKAAAFFAKESE